MTGVLTCDLDRVLDRLCAAECEEHLVEIAGEQSGELLAETRPNLGDERGLDELQACRLLDHRVDHTLVAVPDVDRHQLAVEVEDAPALRRVQPHAFGVVDRNRINGALDGPREEGVVLRQPCDLLAGHTALRHLDGHIVLGSSTSRPVGMHGQPGTV